ncbi:MAG: dihydroxy-acid dehydratase [Rhodobacteraceae bacterium]|nr:dihydroxy-acid dehydratase [Paracoccaceae bacterium]
MATDDNKTRLRSAEWFAREGKYGFVPRSWMRSQGFSERLLKDRPVIGICNTWSELTNCNRGLKELAEHVKRGVLMAGGFPLEFPVTSLGEPFMRPTTMMFRNLVSMDVEETLRANPIDGVVLLCGCDKTTPALMMGAASCDLPSIVVSTGPMLNGRFRGRTLGSGTDMFKLDEDYRSGAISKQEFSNAEAAMSRSIGTCMTMGTASTMASLAEAMGMALPLNGAIPAPDSRRAVLAELSGSRIVELVNEDIRMSRILTRDAIENAIVVNGAIGGSTNAVMHLLALAGRLGVDLALDDWDRLGRDVPCLVDLKPSGRFLMEEFFEAGGLPVVMRRIADRLHLTATAVEGGTIGDRIADAEGFDDEVIRTIDNPVTEQGGIVVLRGNLAPDGAILKSSAASPGLMKHTGKAVVFESAEDFRARVDDPELDVDENSVFILRNSGPRGHPGMPEVGSMAIPKKLIAAGVTDVVRISDARMSGTAFGTVLLHVAPESAVGGPLAAVETGDTIVLDVAARRLEVDLSEQVLQARLAALDPKPSDQTRGYAKLYVAHVQQADKGADFDFLVGGSGTPPSTPSF